MMANPKRTLAGTVGSHQGMRLPELNFQVHASENLFGIHRYVQVFDNQRMRH